MKTEFLYILSIDKVNEITEKNWYAFMCVCVFIFEKVVIGGRNKYLINGSNANNTRVQDLFRSVQLNVNNPHFLIMQGRITKVLNMKPPEVWRHSALYIGIGDSEILLNKSKVLGNFSIVSISSNVTTSFQFDQHPGYW